MLSRSRGAVTAARQVRSSSLQQYVSSPRSLPAVADYLQIHPNPRANSALPPFAISRAALPRRSPCAPLTHFSLPFLPQLPTSPRRVCVCVCVCRWPLAGALEHAAHVLTCAPLGAAVVSSATSRPSLPLPSLRYPLRVSRVFSFSYSFLFAFAPFPLFVPACVASSGVVAPRWHRLHRSIHPKQIAQ